MSQKWKRIGAVIGVVFALTATPCSALDWSTFVSFGFTWGGDSVGKAQTSSQTGTTGTQSTTTHNARAGQFMLMSTGATFAVPGLEDWDAQASAGYWFDTVSGNGGEIRFRRFPIELVAAKTIDNKWRVGGGLSYHAGVERVCTQTTCASRSAKFDNALGVVIEGDWLLGGRVTQGISDQRPTTKLWVGSRITLINYKSPAPESRSYSGNNIGFILGLNF